MPTSCDIAYTYYYSYYSYFGNYNSVYGAQVGTYGNLGLCPG